MAWGVATPPMCVLGWKNSMCGRGLRRPFTLSSTYPFSASAVPYLHIINGQAMPLSHRKRRLEESPNSRDRRLAARRQRRRQESPETRQHRLNAAAEATRASGSQETAGQRLQRLAANAQATRGSRSQEPAEQRQQRLAAMAEAVRRSRSQDTTEQRQHRAEVQAAGDQQRRLRLNDAVEIDGQHFIDRMTRMHTELKQGFNNQACCICKEKFPSLRMTSAEGQTCQRCHRQSRRPGAALFGVENNMVPGPVPPELADLTDVEELLIARILAVTSVHRLPLGQIGYKGHTITILPTGHIRSRDHSAPNKSRRDHS